MLARGKEMLGQSQTAVKDTRSAHIHVCITCIYTYVIWQTDVDVWSNGPTSQLPGCHEAAEGQQTNIASMRDELATSVTGTEQAGK